MKLDFLRVFLWQLWRGWITTWTSQQVDCSLHDCIYHWSAGKSPYVALGGKTWTKESERKSKTWKISLKVPSISSYMEMLHRGFTKIFVVPVASMIMFYIAHFLLTTLFYFVYRRVFRGFPQSIRLNCGLLRELGHGWYHPNLIQFMIHISIRHYIIQLLKVWLNSPKINKQGITTGAVPLQQPMNHNKHKILKCVSPCKWNTSHRNVIQTVR